MIHNDRILSQKLLSWERMRTRWNLEMAWRKLATHLSYMNSLLLSKYVELHIRARTGRWPYVQMCTRTSQEQEVEHVGRGATRLNRGGEGYNNKKVDSSDSRPFVRERK